MESCNIFNMNLEKVNIIKQLDDVNFIRPIVILQLVILHSFTMYGGGWTFPEGINNVRAYFWIARLFNSFMLEMFVFLSGYLFAYQIFHLHKKFTLKSLLKSKFKRLIIPSIVFSLFYSILFYSKPFNVWNYVYDILNGMGHMWFLPMLFWCFVFSYFIIKIKLNEKVKLILP